MIDIPALLKACRFETSRSSGPGGQHVNKTESKVSLFFKIDQSNLSPDQQSILQLKYPTKINNAGELYLQSFASRSQIMNKEAVILKLQNLIESALVPPKKRYKTKKSRASIEARLMNKKIHSALKKNRGGRLEM